MANYGYEPPPPLANPYEQIVKVYTAVFSVLVGISLKDLLTANQFGPDLTGPHLAFGATVFLVIRFLIGSANHLWIESLEHASRSKGGHSASWSFISHLVALSFFGFLLIRICRSIEKKEILLWTAAFALLAALVAMLVVMTQRREPAFSLWRKWFWIDLAQGLGFGALWYWFPEQPINIPMIPAPFSLVLVSMAAISFVGLVIDLHFQIKRLEDIANLPRPDETSKLAATSASIFKLPPPSR